MDIEVLGFLNPNHGCRLNMDEEPLVLRCSVQSSWKPGVIRPRQYRNVRRWQIMEHLPKERLVIRYQATPPGDLGHALS